MKNFNRTAVISLFILTLILACTKSIDLKTEVEFSITEQHQAEGYINEDLPTTLTLVPEEILKEFSYSYSYSVSKGGGFFKDDTGEIVEQNAKIALNPLSATMMYVGSKAGEHIVKITAKDNYGFTQEVQLDYTVAEIPPLIWTATSPVQRIELGNSAQITVTLETPEVQTDANYERSYRLISGSGTLTEVSTGAEIDGDGLRPIAPGTYLLNFRPDELGFVELSFELRGDDNSLFPATLTFEVLEKIVDTVAPEITLLGEPPFTVQRGGNYKDPGATATDDIDGDISGNIIIDASDVDTTQIGTYRVTYNVSDTAGNPAYEVTRRVEVIFGNIPQKSENEILAFAFPGQEEAAEVDKVNHTVTLTVPFGTDINVAPTAVTLSDGATVSPSMNEPQNFENSVTYTVTAENGDVQEWVVNVTIDDAVDTTPPIISLTGVNPQLIEIGGTYVELGATATDAVGGDVTPDIIINSDVVNPNKIGNYSVTYDVRDAAGNPAEQVIRTVKVEDTTPPIITLSGGSMSIAAGESYIEPGYSATDNFDGNITGQVTVVGNINTNVLGTYTLNYTVSDAAGNTAVQKTRTIQVIDNQRPVISLLGDDVIMKAGEAFIDPGYSATDNVDGNLTGNVLRGGNLNTNREGNYTVTYNVSDSSGNAANQMVRNVTVYVPVSGINVSPDFISLLIGHTVQLGTTVTPADASDASVSWASSDTGIATVNSVGLVLAKSTGTVTVTATANDGSGVTGTKVVRIVDSEFDRNTGEFRARPGSIISVRLAPSTKGISPNGLVSISISESGLNDYTHSWIGEWEDELLQTFTMPASGKVLVIGSHTENANIGNYEVSQTSFAIGIQGGTPFTFTFNNQNRLPN